MKNFRSNLLNAIAFFVGMSLLMELASFILNGSTASFLFGFSIGVWVCYGYRKIFDGMPVSATLSQAVRAYVLALCWPVSKS